MKILITAALPYANGAIHFGHLAGAYLPADCYARFQRQKGNDVLFISGSDEYGVAVSLSAELAKRSPKEQVDIYHKMNKELFDKLAVSFDHYSRTTWQGHVAPSQEYFLDLKENGYVDERDSEQLFSPQDNKFLADRYVTGVCPRCGFAEARGDECTKCGGSFEATDLKNPRSKLTGQPLVLKKTRHWYLRLDLFKTKLAEWLSTKNWKPNVVNFVKGYIDDLRPRAITRDTSWGIPLPTDQSEGKVLYVWFEAPIGYISATQEWAELKGDKEAWKKYWLDENTKLVQFVGKDNIPFHAVIFPAMTMGQKKPYKLVDELVANEFYNLEGKQFSKSDGWYIDLSEALKSYDPDMIRYAICSNAPENQDSEFTWKDFQQRVNSDLVGKFGNFIHRTLVFIKNVAGGELPIRGELSQVDKEFLKGIQDKFREVGECYEAFKVRKACQSIMELAQLGNIYFDTKKPWQEAKKIETASSMQTTLALCLECGRLLAIASFPVIPEAAQRIWSMLGFDTPLSSHSIDAALALPIKEIGEAKIIFRKIEDEEIEKEIAKLIKPMQKNESPVVIEQISNVSIDDVRKIDLRLALIYKAERVPKSKKLLRLEVDTGKDKRVIVAGVGHKFEPEQLVGKKVVIVANLQPAKLMGVESQGMLLAASEGDAMALLECDSLPIGAEIR